MDKQTCRVCGNDFDFDKEGLGAERDGKQVVVCSVACARTVNVGSQHNMGPKNFRDGRMMN